MVRYLFGSVTSAFRDQNLYTDHQAGRCLSFGPRDADVLVQPGDTWESLSKRFPPGWQPDAVVLYLYYRTIPDFLWSAPVPLLGLALDSNLQWHWYRRLPGCDLILTDSLSAELFRRQGVTTVQQANLFGCERVFLQDAPTDQPRDIDILFVGNMQPAVQRERLQWLGRLARLAGHYRVCIATGVFGDDYRALLRRSRIVFNRGIRQECNLRTFEAAACGALLFQEQGNREVPDYFRDGQECVFYTEDNLETLLEHYLSHEEERRRLADAAQQKVPSFSFANLWKKTLEEVQADWPLLLERCRKRLLQPGADPVQQLLGWTWEALGATDTVYPSFLDGVEATLAGLPACAELHNALGLLVSRICQAGGSPAQERLERVLPHFERAWACDPGQVVTALNRVEVLAALGRYPDAAESARQLLRQLEREANVTAEALDAPHFPDEYDWFRVEWERAAWQNAGQPAAEKRAKLTLLRWRLHSLLADLTGKLPHYYEAAVQRPDLPSTRAALGCALARQGCLAEASGHLRFALDQHPFDHAAARALYQVLLDQGDRAGADRLAQERRQLRQAAPNLVPLADWFSTRPDVPPGHTPAGNRPRVSLCLIVKNEEYNLPACLASAADLVGEVIVVDTGSIDSTRQVAARHGAKVFDFPWCDSFSAARNECLRHATGAWIFWLDADDRLDEPNRHKLRALLADLPDANVAFVMKCSCLPDPASTSSTVVDHVRLFRNHPAIRWEHRVHEQILPAIRRSGGDVRWSDVTLQHTGYTDATLRRHKLERDMRLLLMEEAEQPDHPFTLFNLGSTYLDFGQHAQALRYLQRSLELSHPNDSIVRKLYALIAGCHRQLGELEQALAACVAGRGHYPDDAELSFVEGNVRLDQDDLAGAERCFRQLLGSRPEAHFASVLTGLRGYNARHNLAVVLVRQGRQAEAEEQWRLALKEQPRFGQAWQGLAELYLGLQRWPEFEEALRQRDSCPGGRLEALVLRARGQLARREFGVARSLLREVIGQAPQAVWPRVLLSHVLLQEGTDADAAEVALRDVLALDPDNAEAHNNLEVLLRQRAAVPPAPQPRPMRLAVVCIVHNEEDFIEPFLDHYFRQGVDRIFLIDNDCSDTTLARARRHQGVVIESLDSCGQLDDSLRTETFQRRRLACRGEFDYVILVDCDEFVVAKSGGDLKAALAPYLDREVLGTEGWEVIQRPDEPAFDPAVLPLAQRRWGVPSTAYDKPVVLRPEGPSRLAVGQHYLLGPEPYPALRPFYLLHLAACDERLFFKRRLQMTSRQGLRNIQQGHSTQHTRQTIADIHRRWQTLQNHPRQQQLPIHTGETTLAAS